MPVEFQIILAVTIVAVIAIPLIFVFAVWLPNYKSIMTRAKKIDPSVKTFADAQYVLQKDIMESAGKNKAENQKDEQNDDKSE